MVPNRDGSEPDGSAARMNDLNSFTIRGALDQLEKMISRVINVEPVHVRFLPLQTVHDKGADGVFPADQRARAKQERPRDSARGRP